MLNNLEKMLAEALERIRFLEERVDKLEMEEEVSKNENHLETAEEFQKWFPILVQKVNELDFGYKFTLPMILEEKWSNISNETRRSLGRVFYKHITSRKIVNVIPINIGISPQEYKKVDMS